MTYCNTATGGEKQSRFGCGFVTRGWSSKRQAQKITRVSEESWTWPSVYNGVARGEGGGREGDFPKQPTSIARSSSALHQLITVSQVMNGPVELFVFSVVCLALQLHLVVLLLLVVVITLIYLNKASFFPLVLIFPFEIPKMVHLDDNHISRSPNCS